MKDNKIPTYGFQQSIVNTGQSPFAKNLDGYYTRKGKHTNSESLNLPDLWGSNVNYNIDGKENYGTKIGFCVTVFAYLTISFLIGYEIYLMVESHSSPDVQFEQNYQSSPIYSDSAVNSFFFRLAFYEGTKLMKKETTLDFVRTKVFVRSYELASGSRVEWDIDDVEYDSALINCDYITNLTNTTIIEGHFPNTQGDSDGYWGDYIQCTQPDQGYITDGNRYSDVSQTWGLRLKPCDSTLSTCKLKTDINAYENIRVNLEIVKIYIDSLNLTYPIRYGIQEIVSASFNVDLNKNYEVFFKDITIETDTNRIFGNIGSFVTSTTHQTFDYMSQDVVRRAVVDDHEDSLVEIEFKSGYRSETISRSYIKLIDMLAEIGGIIEIVTVTLALTYGWYNSLKFEQELLNKAVLYQPENHNKDDYNRHYFTFNFLFKIYMRELCCCCQKKKYDKKEFKLEMSRLKLERDMNIVSNNHAKHRGELIERIQIKPYQMKQIPLAIMIQLENDLEEEDRKEHDSEEKEVIKHEDVKRNSTDANNADNKESDSKRNVDDMFKNEHEENFQEMTQVEAADTLVSRMKDMESMDFVESQLNLWLISILDIDVLKKKKKKFTNVMHDSILTSMANSTGLLGQDMLDIKSFLRNNGIDENQKVLDIMYKTSKTIETFGKGLNFNKGDRQNANSPKVKKWLIPEEKMINEEKSEDEEEDNNVQETKGNRQLTTHETEEHEIGPADLIYTKTEPVTESLIKAVEEDSR